VSEGTVPDAGRDGSVAGDDEIEFRIAVVTRDPRVRSSMVDALTALPGIRVLAWAESVDALAALGTRADFCVCDTAPAADEIARLLTRGCTTVVVGPDADPVTALEGARERRAGPQGGPRRPRLAPRQLEVLVAYVVTSDLLPTIARRLDMDSETFKTHLRRVRVKYAQAGRPAPTRRDLYVRAVEDGLVPAPEGKSWH
jgi:hypothetical protein